MGDNRGTRVYVGNLCEKVKKEDLEGEFTKYGKLKSVWVASRPPFCAFVHFESHDNADKACDILNDTEVLGSKLIVRIQRTDATNDNVVIVGSKRKSSEAVTKTKKKTTHFIVSRILSHRMIRKKLQYMVLINDGFENAQWIQASELNCPDLIEEYNNLHQLDKEPKFLEEGILSVRRSFKIQELQIKTLQKEVLRLSKSDREKSHRIEALENGYSDLKNDFEHIKKEFEDYKDQNLHTPRVDLGHVERDTPSRRFHTRNSNNSVEGLHIWTLGLKLKL